MVVAMHHPPFLTGIADIDSMSLEDRDSFGASLSAIHKLSELSCGHAHRPITARYRGTVATVSPGSAHQVALDFNGGGLRWTLEPPVVSLHVWLQDSLIS